MKAIVRTACGCEKEIDIKECPLPEIIKLHLEYEFDYSRKVREEPGCDPNLAVGYIRFFRLAGWLKNRMPLYCELEESCPVESLCRPMPGPDENGMYRTQGIQNFMDPKKVTILFETTSHDETREVRGVYSNETAAKEIAKIENAKNLTVEPLWHIETHNILQKGGK